ncbi:hypothetical protein TSTA_041870 [Talaromyces stipitatus ATCC 10500]|uniref:Uncharacterized protein n=1 Tax=Talaromyces stipitatus (strain ATCC 10500 / CBS 375.48 / QM 6759 / NRRL 1006) TaxID=441959 RepID=B8MJC2_TALSN|nr:uncharacterized protein TSTA_041870 [Talaromyces stipitatus ATCC 10500]XP_002484665.1 uncharacterized protein TSTA_041870 [Talaromyces stipitatus ATCC 10500]EED14711.1 hypothetical protein TSTA_041870 [Talaromyces stipitatus ATCC 10500]EED14712.1 hypothetical protein TSTA_041870 [Talaromyces stipitatus ATCC 10500]
MPVSKLAWKRLTEAQEYLQEEEEQALTKILQLWKQQKLLKKRAGEFLQRDIKDVEELEKLEEKEEEERKKWEAEKRKEAEASRARQNLAAALKFPSSADIEAFDPSILDDSFLD